MRTIRLLAAFLLLACLVFPGIAQDKRTRTKQHSDLLRQEEQKRQEEALQEAWKSYGIPTPSFLGRFIGTSTNDWVVSIVSEGGIFGTRIISTINSEGKLYCSSTEQEIQFVDIEKDRFEAVSRLVAATLNASPFQLGKSPSSKIKYCTDCSYQSVVVHRRERGTIFPYLFPLLDGSAEASELYDAVAVIKGCPVE